MQKKKEEEIEKAEVIKDLEIKSISKSTILLQILISVEKNLRSKNHTKNNKINKKNKSTKVEDLDPNLLKEKKISKGTGSVLKAKNKN